MKTKLNQPASYNGNEAILRSKNENGTYNLKYKSNIGWIAVDFVRAADINF